MTTRKGKYVPVTEVRPYVQSRTDFTNSSQTLTGRYKPSRRLYIVESFGHWFLFMYSDETKTWYENTTKYNVATSIDHSRSHPLTDTIELPHDQMMVLYNYGPAGLTKRRLTA